MPSSTRRSASGRLLAAWHRFLASGHNPTPPASSSSVILTTSTNSTTTSTTGGSVLPTITAELLWFESFTHGAPERAVTLPNGDVAFAHRDAVHAMPEAEWRQFLAYQQAAA